MPSSYYDNSDPLPEEFMLMMLPRQQEPHLCEETPDQDGYYLFRKQLQQQPHVSPGDRAARLGILPAAILESAILFNLVTWMVTGSQWPNAVAATLPFAVALAFARKGPPAD